MDLPRGPLKKIAWKQPENLSIDLVLDDTKKESWITSAAVTVPW